jgi:fatty-acyl-CoA synthase
MPDSGSEIPDHRIRTSFVRRVYHALSDSPGPTPTRSSSGSFRVIVSGGSAVSPALIGRVRERWGIPMLQGWGMTETSPMCCLSHPPRDTRAEDESAWRAKSGRPVPGMEVRLVDEANERLPEDGYTVGELQLRGPWVTGGYHQGASPSSFTADGWLRTGDIGYVDDQGRVTMTDRLKDVIVVSGFKVFPSEVEEVVCAHPGVREAAAVGIPAASGEAVKIIVVASDPALTEDVLIAHCRRTSAVRCATSARQCCQP